MSITSERRKVFRKLFAGRLIQAGFFLKDNTFNRIGDNVLIRIGARVRHEGFFIRWNTYTFCEGFDEETLKCAPEHGQIEHYMARDNPEQFRRYYDLNETEKIDWAYQVFFRDVFPNLDTVRDVESHLSYLQSIYNDSAVLNCEYMAWQYIYLKRYSIAAECLSNYINMIDKSEKPIPNHVSVFRDRQAYLLSLIENQETDLLEIMLQERLRKSQDACREYFGSRIMKLI